MNTGHTKMGTNPTINKHNASSPYNFNLHRETNVFQARSKGSCLSTTHVFCIPESGKLKRQCRIETFLVTDGFASILFQSLMLKYVSHYSWLQADHICYPHLLSLLSLLSRCTNMEVLGGLWGFQSVFFTIHPGGQEHSPVMW